MNHEHNRFVKRSNNGQVTISVNEQTMIQKVAHAFRNKQNRVSVNQNSLNLKSLFNRNPAFFKNHLEEIIRKTNLNHEGKQELLRVYPYLCNLGHVCPIGLHDIKSNKLFVYNSGQIANKNEARKAFARGIDFNPLTKVPLSNNEQTTLSWKSELKSLAKAMVARKMEQSNNQFLSNVNVFLKKYGINKKTLNYHLQLELLKGYLATMNKNNNVFDTINGLEYNTQLDLSVLYNRRSVFDNDKELKQLMNQLNITRKNFEEYLN